MVVGGIAAATTALAGLSSRIMETARDYGRLAKLAGTDTVNFQAGAFAVGTYGLSPDKYADMQKDWQDKVG